MQGKHAGFNKEKLITIICFLIAGASLYYYLTQQPAELVLGQPMIKTEKPMPYDASIAPPLQDVDKYVNKSRKTPFNLNNWKLATQEKPIEVKPKDPIRSVTPPPVQTEKEIIAEKKALAPEDKELPVEFMGTMSIAGKKFAMLRPKDDSPPFRVQVGDTLEGLNYKVTEIEVQTIHLQDAEGQNWTVKDNMFVPREKADSDADSGSGSGSVEDMIKSVEKAVKKKKEKSSPRTRLRDRKKTETDTPAIPEKTGPTNSPMDLLKRFDRNRRNTHGGTQNKDLEASDR